MRRSNWKLISLVALSNCFVLNAYAEQGVHVIPGPASVTGEKSTGAASHASGTNAGSAAGASTTSEVSASSSSGAGAASTAGKATNIPPAPPSAWKEALYPKAGQPDPVKNCQAYLSTLPKPAKKGHHPIKFIAKAVASELGTDGSAMLKDSVFVFSAKDFDPYAKKPPTNKPYTLLEMQMIDGSEASLIKYPDNSGKIVGGYADGTILAELTPDTFVMAYPNGARGKLVKVSNNEYDIYRPDDTVTRITKTSGGDFEMRNSKLGYIGTARTDTEGMQFEMHSSDF